MKNKRKQKILRRFDNLNLKTAIIYKDIDIMVYESGNKYFFKNGHLHREDGPAIIDISKIQYWYLNNVHYTDEEWRLELEKQKRIINTLR